MPNSGESSLNGMLPHSWPLSRCRGRARAAALQALALACTVLVAAFARRCPLRYASLMRDPQVEIYHSPGPHRFLVARRQCLPVPRRHCPPECVFKVGSFIELDLAHVLVLLQRWPGRQLRCKAWGGHPTRVLDIAVCEYEPSQWSGCALIPV